MGQRMLFRRVRENLRVTARAGITRQECGGLSKKIRVCRTWHRTNGVEVPVPGRSRAEGKEKGKGYIVRCGLEEAQSESARRRTGIGYEVWHTQDELARDNEVLHLRKGVLYKSGVYAWKVLCLTPGDLFAEQ